MRRRDMGLWGGRDIFAGLTFYSIENATNRTRLVSIASTEI